MAQYSTTPAKNEAAPQTAAAEMTASQERPLVQLPMQMKLSVGAPDDIYEKEADAVAERVMRMPERDTPAPFNSGVAGIQRKCAHCQDEEKQRIQTKSLATQITPFVQRKGDGGSTASEALSNQINATRGSGSPLPDNTRSFMESRIGADFSGVRVHTGGEAVQMNRELNAQAFTVGRDVYFGAGKYSPDSSAGKSLLAHELTHVVQQGGGRSTQQNTIQRNPEDEPQIPSTRPPAGHLINPFISEEEQALEYAEYLRQRHTYNTQLREAVLAPLSGTRRRSTTVFSKINSLSAEQADILVNDDEFFNQLRPVFRGKSLWVIFIRLYFHNRIREPHLRLSHALMTENARLLVDMLSIVIENFSNSRYFDFLREAVLIVFRRNPLLREILRLIDRRSDPQISQRIDHTYREVHYEKGSNGSYKLEKFTGRISANTYFSGNELRAIVRMRFFEGDDQVSCPTAGSLTCQPFYFLGRYAPYYTRWQNVMTRYWNDKFTLTNGVDTYSIVFVPLFMSENDPEAVKIRIITNNALRCQPASTPGRSNQTCWFLNADDGTIGHEFGHIIGATDEYRIPGSYREVRRAGFQLSPEDLSLSTVEGIRGVAKPVAREGYYIANSTMNDNSNNAQLRHLTRLVRFVNQGLSAGVPPFTLHRK